jgi:predicted PurR-regulated permease PerM
VCFYFFFNIVIYLLIAFVLSMVGQPVMKFLLDKLNIGKLKWGSAIAAIITMVFFILLTVSLISLLAPVLIDQAQQLAKVDYSTMMQALNEPIDRFRQFLEGLGIEPKSNFSKDIVVNLFNDWFDPAKISYIFTSIFGWATEFLIGVFSVLFITFFFLQEQGILIKIILALVPTEYEVSTKNAIEDSIYLLRRYFSGVLLQMTIITIIVTIGLLIVGIENAFLIGLIAALLNVIPYLGPLMGAAFALAITLVSNSELPFYEEMFPLLVSVAIVFAIMQLVDNFILQPFIFSNRVMAHPLEIFIVVLVAAKVGLLVGVGSIVGMVLAIPVYTILRVIARTFLSEFKIVQKMTERMKTD